MRLWPPVALAASAALATGCVEMRPKAFVDSSVPPAPETRRAPAPPPAPPAPPAPVDLAVPTEGAAPLTITPLQAVDVALRNNPDTKRAWFVARAAAASLGGERSALYPSVELDASFLRQKQAALGGQSVFYQTVYGPTASLNWLLFDFGGRSADIDEAKQALNEALFLHDATLNNVILQVLQAYYGYEGAKALREAQEASLKQAEANLRAAEERHNAGVATIADVLQARTVVSQQRLAYQTVDGQIAVIRGALATALGVPANTPVEAGELPRDLDVDRVTKVVDDLIAMAERQRPDLAAARTRVLAAKAHLSSVRSSALPTLGGAATYGRNYYGGAGAAPHADVYSAGVLLRIPVFSGFQKVYDIRKAEEEEATAEANAAGFEQQVIQEVWSSYYAMKTAGQKIRTTRDLVASATESAAVTRGRYTAGVGNILDLLTAESALASARAQDVLARAEFLFALAQLARDVGAIETAVKEAP
ncbi:MAG TPA: TolC family protein [Thermoanaerobaculia bacterium]|nr:TolC family protein [Thermoanaerobaculia bacterium]